MRTIPLLLIVLLAGPAEAKKQPWVNPAPWSDSLAALFSAPGTGSISGQVFARTEGGEVKIGAGCGVVLMPDLPYFREWFARELSKGDAGDDPRIKAASRDAVADASGNFHFGGLARQPFIAWTIFKWQASTGYRYVTATYGGAFLGFADCSKDSAAVMHLELVH